MNETGLSLVPRWLHRDETVCSSSDNEVAGAVLQNWFFVQDFWPMGHSGSLVISLSLSFSLCFFFVTTTRKQARVVRKRGIVPVVAPCGNKKMQKSSLAFGGGRMRKKKKKR